MRTITLKAFDLNKEPVKTIQTGETVTINITHKGEILKTLKVIAVPYENQGRGCVDCIVHKARAGGKRLIWHCPEGTKSRQFCYAFRNWLVPPENMLEDL